MQTDCHADLALDIAIASRTSVPVLISGRPDDTMRVAMAIASSNGNGHRGALVVAEAAQVRLMWSTLDADAADHHPRRIVLLRDIEQLDRHQQEWMIETILSRCRSALPEWRLITTTSVPLAGQVAVGAFAPRLFYLLNAIHIVI